MDKINELKEEMLKTKMEYFPNLLTDEEKAQLNKSNEEKKVETIDITDTEIVDTLRDSLKSYVKNREQLDAERERELDHVRNTYSESVLEGKKSEVIAEYREKENKMSESIRNYLDVTVKYLNKKIDSVEDVKVIPSEALTEVALLEKLDIIEAKEMQNIVDRYKNSNLVIKVLSQIGEKHKLYFEPKDVSSVKSLTDQLKSDVINILNSNRLDELTYTERVLLADSGNGIDRINKQIDDYINGTVEVRG